MVESFTDEASLSGDWTTTSGAIVVTDDVAESDSQSVRIPAANPEHVLSLDFNPLGSSVVFVDYYMRNKKGVIS
jgi:hypothetical protein